MASYHFHLSFKEKTIQMLQNTGWWRKIVWNWKSHPKSSKLFTGWNFQPGRSPSNWKILNILENINNNGVLQKTWFLLEQKSAGLIKAWINIFGSGTGLRITKPLKDILWYFQKWSELLIHKHLTLIISSETKPSLNLDWQSTIKLAIFTSILTTTEWESK